MTNFKIPKNGNIMMPFNFGPKDNDVRNSGWYRDVSMLIVPYKTDADILRKIIPEQFKISDEPTISVNYACNKEIDWLAGRNYNLISVSVEAIFSGDVDEVAASYNLVMWGELNRSNPYREERCKVSQKSMLILMICLMVTIQLMCECLILKVLF